MQNVLKFFENTTTVSIKKLYIPKSGQKSIFGATKAEFVQAIQVCTLAEGEHPFRRTCFAMMESRSGCTSVNFQKCFPQHNLQQSDLCNPSISLTKHYTLLQGKERVVAWQRQLSN